MIRLIAVVFALAVAASAQAMSPVPLHQPDGMITQVRHTCGAGMRRNEALGRCATTSARHHVRRGVIRSYQNPKKPDYAWALSGFSKLSSPTRRGRCCVTTHAGTDLDDAHSAITRTVGTDLPSGSSTTINKSPNQQYEHCAHDSSDKAGILIWPIPANGLPEVGRRESANDAKDRC
jgi:hypothetical protein